MSDWGSDVCSSDLLNPRLDAGGKRSHRRPAKRALAEELGIFTGQEAKVFEQWLRHFGVPAEVARSAEEHVFHQIGSARHESIVGSGQRFHDRLKVITGFIDKCVDLLERSEEHTSELQSLMRTSYAVFCLKKKKSNKITHKIK